MWMPPKYINILNYRSELDACTILKCGCRVTDRYLQIVDYNTHYCVSRYIVKVVEDQDDDE